MRLKKRIWELDAFRGLCVLGMVAVHLVYDLTELVGLWQWEAPPAFRLVQQWGGVLFLLISGVSATLGSHSVRRGLAVFACGMVCSAVTAGMYRLGMADKGIIIWFGVLHCLGICMLLWAAVKRWPRWALAAAGAVLAGLGLYLGTLPPVDHYWFTPLGLVGPGFVSSDYFPLLPHFGFFLLGAALGRTVYRDGTTRLPKAPAEAGPIRFLRFCGRHSLELYMLHQPILAGTCYLIALLVGRLS